MFQYLKNHGGQAGHFIRFCCVGGLNFLVDFSVYGLLSLFIPIYPARVGSWVAACLFSYLMNRRWTFKAADRGILPLLRFFSVNLASLVLGLGLLYLFTSLGCGRILAYLLTIPFTMLANYLGYRFWSFRTFQF